EREAAAGGDVAGARDGRAIVGPLASEGVRRLEVVLVVGAQEPAGGGEGDAVTDAGEDVLQRAPRAAVVEDLAGGDHRQAMGEGAAAPRAGRPRRGGDA